MAGDHIFNNISLRGRDGTNPGQLRVVHTGGIVWKKQGDVGNAVQVDKADILGLTWMKVPRTNQLGVTSKEGSKYRFTGFRDQDVCSLTSFYQTACGITPDEKQLSVSGENWGEVDLKGNMLSFQVGSKQVFEVALDNVSRTKFQGKNDVMMEFHVDDMNGSDKKDSLMEINFHIPDSNTQFVGDENCPPAQVFRNKILSMANVMPGGEEAVVTFEGIAILTPRGRYNIEVHSSFMRLQGHANDFKIQYNSIVSLFLLPKSNQPHTFVVVSLDPPIRKGHTVYPHIVFQFEVDHHIVECTLPSNVELFNNKLEHKGLIHEVFTAILQRLSGAKVTRPGKFRSCQDGYAVKSSLKAEDGIFYPLEKSFFFLPKPPTLILHDEINYVEFEMHAAGGSNMHYFDLRIRLKTEQEHLFRNIQRNEYHDLYDFISLKGLKIMNLGGPQAADGVADVLQNDKNSAGGDESDEEDEDFVAEKDDSGSLTDDSGGEDSDASDSGGMKEKSDKKEPKKEPKAHSKTPESRKRMRTKDGEEDGVKKKKPKTKKDPNAPKKSLSAFMFFSKNERENVKKTNPGISFTDVGRVLGERWNKMSGEEKELYEAYARQDKKRFTNEMKQYTKQSKH